MSDAVDLRFAPPQAHVADVESGDLVLAQRGTRFLAAIVDLIVAVGVYWAVFKIPALEALGKARTQEAGMSLWNWMPLSFAVAAVTFLAVQGWLLVARGQTVGKLLLKMRIVRSDGAKADAWHLLGLRYGIGLLTNLNPLISAVYGIVDALLIFRSSRKCLHDSIADTQVIKL